MSESKYKVILKWDKRDKIYVAEVPELPGCMAHGMTRAEAVHAAEEAIHAWTESARLDGMDVPEPTGRVTA